MLVTVALVCHFLSACQLSGIWVVSLSASQIFADADRPGNDKKATVVDYTGGGAHERALYP